jgi:glycine oxidase
MQINGLYRHGYLIAPAMMDAALQVLRGESQTLAKRFDLQIQQATLSQSLV